MGWLADPQVWVALVTLTAIEIVLGVDNIIFIAIMARRLPQRQQQQARMVGLWLAMAARIGLLLSLTWIMRLSEPLLSVWGHAISGRDLLLVGGGLFLRGKSTLEIHEALESPEGHRNAHIRGAFLGVIAQIVLLDLVFSLDSVLTAIGLAKQIPVMVAAIVIAVLVMMAASKPISQFIEEHPTLRILALSFLLLIGMTLIAEGLGLHVPKGYVYFSMVFSVFVEVLNTRIRKRQPMHLRRPLTASG